MAGKRMSKAEFINTFAEKTGMNRKQATATLNTLNAMAAEQLARGGEVVIPGLVKLNVAEKPATQERQGINPFTKQPMTFKAKPARRVVKAHPVKALKDALSPRPSATPCAWTESRLGACSLRFRSPVNAVCGLLGLHQLHIMPVERRQQALPRRIPTGAIGLRAHAELPQLADVPVLQVCLIPEFHRILRLEILASESSGWNSHSLTIVQCPGASGITKWTIT